MATRTPAQDGTRSAKPERATVDLKRMGGLSKAATMLGGQQSLADVLGIDVRSVRAKINDATRGVFDSELEAVATALERHAAKLIEHAGKLRALMPPAGSAD